jgi:hypothetical protein
MGVATVLLITWTLAIFSCGKATSSAPQPNGDLTAATNYGPPPATQTTTPDSSTSTSTTDKEFKYNLGNYYEFDLSSKADMSSGAISFKLRGLSYDSLPAGQDAFFLLAMLTTPSGAEGNFQFNIADLSPRLISQRFDGTCPKFCENQAIGSVNWRAAETYSFAVSWTSSTVTCLVKDSAGGVVFSQSVPTDGVYAGSKYVRVGNGVLPPYGGSANEITIINPKIS